MFAVRGELVEPLTVAYPLTSSGRAAILGLCPPITIATPAATSLLINPASIGINKVKTLAIRVDGINDDL